MIYLRHLISVVVKELQDLKLRLPGFVTSALPLTNGVIFDKLFNFNAP